MYMCVLGVLHVCIYIHEAVSVSLTDESCTRQTHTHTQTHTPNIYISLINLYRPPKLYTQDSKVKFHPKSVNSDETSFDNKFLIYHTKIKSTNVFLHDTSMITPFPLLFFGGKISVDRDGDQQIIAVDDWIKFQAPHHIAKLVKV